MPYLANPVGPQPIYIVSDLCYHVMKGRITCPDHLSQGERQELMTRLQDLGDVVVLSNNEFRVPSHPGRSGTSSHS
jgi:hypothetical protein